MRILGAKWEHICNNPQCYAQVSPYWKFCPWCGAVILHDVVRSHDPRTECVDEVREETD